MPRLAYSLAFVTAIPALACHHRPPPKAPPDLAGDTPLVVANHSEFPLCALTLLPREPPYNWFDDKVVRKHDELRFGVKAGTYKLAAGTCDKPRQFAIIETLKLDKPTYVSIGDGAATAPAGYQSLQVPLRAPGLAPGEACRPRGTASDEPGYCCSQTLDPETFRCQ